MVGKQSKTTDDPTEMGQLFLKIKLAEIDHLSLNAETKSMSISDTVCIILVPLAAVTGKLQT